MNEQAKESIIRAFSTEIIDKAPGTASLKQWQAYEKVINEKLETLIGILEKDT
jgi:hypothetical protein